MSQGQLQQTVGYVEQQPQVPNLLQTAVATMTGYHGAAAVTG